MTTGPWKPIHLETYTARITDVDVRVTISPELNATIDVSYTLSVSGRIASSVEILSPSGALVIGQRGLRVDTQGSANLCLSRGAYDLWWPVGYGEQPLYTVEITIEDQVCGNIKRSRGVSFAEFCRGLPGRQLFGYQNPENRF